ncbi:hypothetical protein [Roseiconus lacunae]|uniref:O-antigen ligase domain-containing protein n=1 Tax=Roseiconus lacunae TaxID=2605694 RepID=A0ABT7PR01_9BACT|nr:hypothetical protein [Roseiconus lacunae]MCD0460335.1 hypothetical protein [Roseiconus lacunae]MDM4018937.1 hypothetical protein [Roseiconus lacunae]WRQ51840.1 hypothetical protein U8335_04705 [Stieleria sp. HD01]
MSDTSALTSSPPRTQPLSVSRTTSSMKLMRAGIWAYVLLLFFEGALRKWFLPGLATPLLVIRDPVALAVIFLAGRERLMPLNTYVVGVFVIGITAAIGAVFSGHGHPFVAAYGARLMLIHFPFAFAMGRILNREDVLKFGEFMLWLTVVMVILAGLQFFSPQSAWVNRGVGGDMEGAGFDGAMGYFRPPGTFSFTNGLTLFLGVSAAFIFYFWLEPGRVKRSLLLAATTALIASIPLSISRALVFEVLITIVFTTVVAIRRPKYAKKLFPAFVGIAFAIGVLAMTPALQTATEVLTSRFTAASKAEGGLEGTLGDRFLGGLLSAVANSAEKPLLGSGLGLGTNVGAKLATGQVQFVLAEAEWARTIDEIGPFLGMTLIMIRTGLAFHLLWLSFVQIGKGSPLPWLLMSFGFLIIAQGGWAQPTALGFHSLIVGLVLASLRPGNSPAFPR